MFMTLRDRIRDGMWRLVAATTLLGLASCFALTSNAVAAEAKATTPKASANELVRKAVSKELSPGNDSIKLMYRMRKAGPERTEVKEYVETDMGTVARLIAINDHPLAPDVQAKEDARLEQLIAKPRLQKDRQRKQKEDEERGSRMVGAIPDAFLFQYEGSEAGKYGETLRLKFEPNPNFDPPTRELKVYQGMSGHMWIDATSNRMVRLEAALFRDVDFGWGILGRLYKGGKFEIEQERVAEGRWEITSMNLDFTGKALMFKSLVIKDQQKLSNFRRVADNLTLAQGIELLRKVDTNQAVAHGHTDGAIVSEKR